MAAVPVFYATTEGHTQRIAATIAEILRGQGFESEAVRLAPGMRPPDWSTIVSAVVGGSLHLGKHQSSVGAFLRREAVHLNRLPAAFFSVSLSAGSRNPAEVAAARDIASAFVRSAQWTPERLVCFAGKLAYTQYGLLTRWLMRRIAAREGGPTDTSRDHDLTDWTAVRDFALAVAADARRFVKTPAA
jgi:menaquinone-dependent protoporphyrinogen oxidase